MVSDFRSDLAKARDAWFLGDDAAGLTDPFILKKPEFEKYLRNRLETAFIAGWNAKEKDRG